MCIKRHLAFGSQNAAAKRVDVVDDLGQALFAGCRA